MKKRSSFLIVLTVIFAVLAIAVFADTAPTVTAKPSLTSLTQGRSFTVSITASGFDTVGSADFNLYYDPAAFSVGNVTNGGMISGDAFVSANTAEAGVVKISAVDMNGFSASGTLVNIAMTALTDCRAGSYSLNLTVGDSYGVDLNGIEVQGVSAAVEVTEAQAAQKTFTLYSYLSGSPASKGSDVSVRLANSNRYSFGSADFVIEYDSDVLAVDSVVFESEVLTEKAAYSINKDIKGTVFISYANPEPVSAYYLFKVNFKTVADREGKTTVSSTVRNVYADDLTAYLPYTASSNVTLNKLPEVKNNPDMWLDTEELIVGRKAVSILKLEKGAGVAAGDFKLTYDTRVLSCKNVTVCGGVSAAGGTIIVDDSYGDGTIEFPYVNTEGYSAEEIELVTIEWEVLKSPETHYTVTIEGNLVADVNYGALELDYVTETGCIYVSAVTLPAADNEGHIGYTCSCGNGYVGSFADVTELDFIYIEGVGVVVVVPTPVKDGGVTVSEFENMTAELPMDVVLSDDVMGTGYGVTLDGTAAAVAVKGDIDGDGKVTVFDAAMIKEALKNHDFENDSLREFAGDVDDISGTTEADVGALLSRIVENSFVE